MSSRAFASCSTHDDRLSPLASHWYTVLSAHWCSGHCVRLSQRHSVLSAQWRRTRGERERETDRERERERESESESERSISYLTASKRNRINLSPCGSLCLYTPSHLFTPLHTSHLFTPLHTSSHLFTNTNVRSQNTQTFEVHTSHEISKDIKSQNT